MHVLVWGEVAATERHRICNAIVYADQMCRYSILVRVRIYIKKKVCSFCPPHIGSYPLQDSPREGSPYRAKIAAHTVVTLVRGLIFGPRPLPT